VLTGRKIAIKLTRAAENSGHKTLNGTKSTIDGIVKRIKSNVVQIAGFVRLGTTRKTETV
jgi:hypothetical protein